MLLLCHFITSRKLGRAASMDILLVIFNFLGDSAHCPLAYTSFRLDFMMRIPLIEVKNNRRALSSRNGFHDGGKKLRSSWDQFQHVKLIQIKSHDIFIVSTLHFTYDLDWKSEQTGYKMDGQRIAPLNSHFVYFIIQWVLIQITKLLVFLTKPECDSSIFNLFIFIAYVSSLHQVSLGKMSTHWGNCLSHCSYGAACQMTEI